MVLVLGTKYSVHSTQYSVLGAGHVVWVAALVVLANWSPGVAAEGFAEQMAVLAAKCDELGLAEQARISRGWMVPRHAVRQYLFLPAESDPTAVKAGAAETVQQWQRRFRELRRERAAELFAAAKEASASGEATRAYALLYEVLHEDAEHAEARRVLGYVKQAGQWRPEGWERAAARSGAFPHPKLGWAARSYWSLETPHYTIVSNHSPGEAVEAGKQLENLHALWRQIFFSYWSTPEALAARLGGANEPLSRSRPKMQVVVFKSREEYAARVAEAHPKARSTLGLYDDKQRIAYFFGGDTSVYPTWYHEGTHQLFQEMVPDTFSEPFSEPGSERDFWALEGVALYMESLAERGHYWTVGGCEAERLQLARYRVLSGDLEMPLGSIAAQSRAAIQDSDEIGRTYTAAAGLTHFFLDGNGGAYRSGFIDYLSDIYRGKSTFDALVKSVGPTAAAVEQPYRAFLKVTDDDLAAVPTFSNSVHLSLCRAEVSDAGLAKLTGTKKLKWVDLSFTRATDEGLKPFAANTSLKQLFLEGTRVTKASLPLIASFKQLEELDLSRLSIGDEDLLALRGLKQLEHLHVAGTQVTADGIKKLKSALPKLHIDSEP